MWRGLGRGSVCGALIGFGFGPDVNIGAAVGVGRVGVGAVSRSGSVFGVVGRGRADYIGEVRGAGVGRTCGVCFSAFVPLVSCSSVFASAVFCSLISVCGHGAYTQVKRRVWAVLLHCMLTSPAYAQQSHWVCTVISLCAC